MFQKNGYSENFTDRSFKLFLNRIHILQLKKILWLVLPYLGTISLQTRTKLQKSIKGVLNCCKLQVIFKSQNKLCNNFRFKDPVPQILTSGVVYKFQCGLCNESYYGECVRHNAVRSSEHIGISPLTNKRIQPRIDSAVCHQLLNCNYSPTFVDFSVLCRTRIRSTFQNWKKGFLSWEIDYQWIETNIPPLSICLKGFFSQFLLCSVDFCDQLFTYFT